VPAADGVRAVLARHSFGWRQATAGLLAALAMTGPAVLGTAWVWSTLDAVGPDGRTVAALRASDVPVVPAAGRQIQSAPEAARVLLLDPSAADDVTASLLGRDGRQLTALSRAVTAQTVRGGWGAAQPADPDRADEQLAQGVGRLVAGADDDVAPDLAALAVGAVLVPPAAEDASAEAVAARGALVAQLDGTSGLERVTETASGIIWRVAVTDRGTTTAWARLADDAAGTPAVVPARDGAVRTAVEASGRDRLLVLAERADPGWRAELDGRPLRAVQSGWQQAFEVGRDDGLLTVEHVAPSRGLWAVVQGVVLVVALLLAVPVRRRRGGAR
ncbi:MAG: glycosyltransferase family 2 protein, partial [Actinotalea sp.]|nr:glycosyltransferase family 2 protein [Actinotalea sp.]